MELKIGFVPLLDCAPLAVAQELGIFEKHGLNVRLCREPGWATIRDKILYGEIDAANAIAGMPISLSFGLGSPKMRCITGFILNSQGNAITLSSELIDEEVADPKSLIRYAKEKRKAKPLVLAVVHPFSSHHLLVHQWLRSARQPCENVRLIVLPPPLVVRNLELGLIDGFCAGEPYNTIAQDEGIGKIVQWSDTLAPLHPEKALIVKESFAMKREQEHLQLIRALDEACLYCDDPENSENLSELIAGEEYLGIASTSIHPNLRSGLQHQIYHKSGVNRPDGKKVDWLISEMLKAGLIKQTTLDSGPSPSEIFREDIYESAFKGAKTGDS